MRVEVVIVASSAALADRDPSHPTLPSVVRDQRTKVYRGRSIHGPSGQPLEDIGTDLVAPTTNRRAEVQCHLGARHAPRLEEIECTLDDAAGGAAPTRMQQRRGTRRMREKHRNAIGDRNGHARAPVESEVPVRVSTAQPTFPSCSVRDHTVAVDLPRGGEPRTCSRELVPKTIPPPHDLAHRLVPSDPEAAGASCRREGPYPDRG